MKTLFINEVECYSVLNKYGIRLPRYSFITSITKTFHSSFDDGEDIVLKGVVDNIWHKSDQNLLKFSTFSNSEIKKTYKQFYSINLVKKDWKGLLICERINYADLSLPSELLVSIRRDNSCGNVITLGFGGLYTELWSAEFLNSVLHFFPDLYSETTALKQLEDSLLFKILLGKIRQGTKLTTQKNIKNFLSSIWRLSKNLVKEKISFIEINPLVISKDGRFVALDAVGKFETPNSVYNNHIDRISKDELKELFNPQRIAIAGVSSNKKAFANIVLDHLKKSKIEQKNIVILKPGAEEFEGIKCISAISELKDPVDILILSLPAPTALEVIKQIYQTNKVKIIQLVSGGIGDSADHDDYKNQLLEIIRVNKHKDRPLIIGPNALGILLAPQKLNTLFIPENKLRINFDPDSNIGLISQSGAFFITRISKMPSLSVRFGMCVGNQLDLSATIILRAMLNDNAIEVVGLYLEGPPQGDALSLAKVINEFAKRKKIIVYRAGKSSQGKQAAAGHTGAIATDYKIEKKLLNDAGAIVCEDFRVFENSLMWFSSYPKYSNSNIHNIRIISNAGYETVAGADKSVTGLQPFSKETNKKLLQVFKEAKLSNIVSTNNPLDLTPMANDQVYLECCKIILNDSQTDLLICGIVPLTVMVETEDEEIVNANALRYYHLVTEVKKPFAIVVEGGKLYDKFKDSFLNKNIPVFNSIQDVFEVLNR
jgi:acyl-CoA synthetase (NDP forming)